MEWTRKTEERTRFCSGARASKATHLCLCYLAAAVCIRAYMLSPCSAVAACLFWEQAQKAGRTLRYQRSLGVSAFRNERTHDALFMHTCRPPPAKLTVSFYQLWSQCNKEQLRYLRALSVHLSSSIQCPAGNWLWRNACAAVLQSLGQI